MIQTSETYTYWSICVIIPLFYFQFIFCFKDNVHRLCYFTVHREHITISYPVCILQVKAVGPGVYGEDGNRKPLEIPVGSSVMYSKYAGSDYKSKDGTQYIVVKAGDVLALLS